MATDEVTILNDALVALGEDLIVSPGDHGKRARLTHAAFPTVRDEILRRGVWNCARRRMSLPADETAPEFGFDYAYTLPSDFIRMVDETDADNPDWQLEGNKLLSDNGPPFQAVYIRRIGPDRMDPLLAGAIACGIAARTAKAFVQDKAERDALVAWCEKKIKDAALASAQENSIREWDEDLWLRSRLR